ncbi:hypothetical protein BDZ91DRAFT_768780 [Kalaharituber pfeilii]|nr:hypothetical protein BDZ91DRAFT_768780 [Kalaharituber pfeilii]
MSVQRTVFSSELTDYQDESRPSGVLEVALRSEKGRITQKVVCYRAWQGKIRDISEEVHASVDPAGLYLLTKDLSSAMAGIDSDPSEKKFGFHISVMSPGTESASFKGTFTSQKGDQPEQVFQWEGVFYCFRDTPLEVIRKGPPPIPADIEEFLQITPIVNIPDSNGNNKRIEQAQTWAKNIYRDLLLHSLSTHARGLFFKELGELGNKFANDNLHGAPLPDFLSSSGPYHFLRLTNMLHDNREFLYPTVTKLVCHELKSADWLQAKYRNSIKDNVEAWVDLICSPDSADVSHMLPSPVDNFLRSILNSLEGAFRNLRAQYQNSTARAYYAAYVTLRPQLLDYFPDAAGYYQKVKDVLLSPNYMEHFLPTLINTTDDQTGVMIPLATRLGMIRDKLGLLSYIASDGRDGRKDDIALILKTLADAANDTGLLREKLHDIDLLAEKLGVGGKFDEEMRLVDQISKLESAIRTVNLGFNPFASLGLALFKGSMRFAESQLVHYTFLMTEAKALGVYDWNDKDTVLDILGTVTNPLGTIAESIGFGPAPSSVM